MLGQGYIAGANQVSVHRQDLVEAANLRVEIATAMGVGRFALRGTSDRIMQLEIITHYASRDKDCSGNYCSVEVKIGGNSVRRYYEHRWDKATELAEAFIDGYVFNTAHQRILETPVIRTSVNDCDL